MNVATRSKLGQVVLTGPVAVRPENAGERGNPIPIPGARATEDLGSRETASGISPPESVKHLPQTEANLIERCLRGDQEAWAALFEQYTGLIYSIAWRFGLSREDAADVFQSVALKLLEGLKDLRDRTKLRPWLARVTVHECIRMRQRSSRPWVSLENLREDLPALSDQSMRPDEAVQRLQEHQLVRQALSMMGEPGCRLLTHLFLEEGTWSYKKIARELGIPVSSIGPMRGRCLQKMHRLLTGLGL